LFSDKDIDEILEMCSRATPGPWEAEHGEWDCDWECGKKPSDPPCYKEIGECEHIRLITPAGVSGTFTVECGDYAGLSNEDAQLIALSRNLLPALAQSWLEMAGEVERLRKIETAARALCEWEETPCPYCESNEHDGDENPPRCTCFDDAELNKELDAALGIKPKEDDGK
jgi:hypothetical protein